MKSRMPQPLFLGLGTSNLRVPARLSVDESDSSVGGVAGGAYSPGQGPPCRPNNSRGKPPRPGWVPWQRHPSPLVGLCCCCVEGTCTCQPMNKKFTLSCTRWELRWNMKYLAPRSQPRPLWNRYEAFVPPNKNPVSFRGFTCHKGPKSGDSPATRGQDQISLILLLQPLSRLLHTSTEYGNNHHALPSQDPVFHVSTLKQSCPRFAVLLRQKHSYPRRGPTRHGPAHRPHACLLHRLSSVA